MYDKEDRDFLVDFLDNSKHEILDKWFTAHNDVCGDVFFESDFRPSHVISLLITIERVQSGSSATPSGATPSGTTQ